MWRYFLFFSISVLSLCSFAETFIVDPNGNGDFPTIQSAVDVAQNGDTVLLRDGIYTGKGNRNILIDQKQINIISENGCSNCIIDCERLGQGFNILYSNDTFIKGITIINGIAGHTPGEADGGGAVEISQSIVEIQSCSFKNCYAKHIGGAINCRGRSADLTLKDSVVEDCETDWSGGGIGVHWSGIHIKNCIIKKCATYLDGGGIDTYLTWGSIENVFLEKNRSMQGGGIYITNTKLKMSIDKCHFRNNHASFYGSGIHARHSDLDVINCLFDGNGWEYEPSAAVYGEDSTINLVYSTLSQNRCGYRGLRGEVAIINTILWGNLLEIYPIAMERVDVLCSDIEGGYQGIRNINENPLFVRNGYWIDEQEYVPGDYRLSRGSPCIEAGYNWNKINEDILGTPRPYDWIGIDNNLQQPDVDMGCYELFNAIPNSNAGNDQTVYAWIDGLADVQLNGMGSYDEDGDALAYYWFDANELIATGAEPNVVLGVGAHVIELIVNDGIEDSEPNACVVTVVPAMETDAKMLPQSINMKSGRGQVIGRLVFEGEVPPEVDTEQPMLLLAGDCEIEANGERLVYSAEERCWYLAGIFDCTAVMDSLPDGDEALLTLVSRFDDGQWVYGADTVKVKH